jgi:hypothetical protein
MKRSLFGISLADADMELCVLFCFHVSRLLTNRPCQARLIQGAQILSIGSPYESNGPLVSAIAYVSSLSSISISHDLFVAISKQVRKDSTFYDSPAI